jgi:hypothetical protein
MHWDKRTHKQRLEILQNHSMGEQFKDVAKSID